MISIENTEFNKDVLLKISYSFGKVFIFKTFIVAEINEGVSFTWENHAEVVIEDLVNFLGTNGSDMVYISNRINDYSFVPSDWLNYFNKYALKGYCVVSQSKIGIINTKIENLFVKTKMRHFRNIYDAVNWAKHVE